MRDVAANHSLERNEGQSANPGLNRLQSESQSLLRANSLSGTTDRVTPQSGFLDTNQAGLFPSDSTVTRGANPARVQLAAVGAPLADGTLPAGRQNQKGEIITPPNNGAAGIEIDPAEMMRRRAQKEAPLAPTPEAQRVPGAGDAAQPQRDVASTRIRDGKPVEAMVQTNGTVSSFGFDPKGQVRSREEFDPKTNRRDVTSFGEDGRPTGRQIFENGRPARNVPFDKNETVKTKFDSDGRVAAVIDQRGANTTKLEFDIDGKLASRTITGPVKPGSQEAKAGIATQSKSTDFTPDGTERQTTVDSFDKNGTRRLTERTRPDGLLVRSQYDENGKLTQSERMDNDSYQRTVYNADGRTTKSIKSDGTRAIEDVKNDGTRIRHERNPRTGDSLDQVRLPDGTEQTRIETKDSIDSYTRDGKSGQWIQSIENKKMGITTKRWGAPGMDTVEWQEQKA